MIISYLGPTVENLASCRRISHGAEFLLFNWRSVIVGSLRNGAVEKTGILRFNSSPTTRSVFLLTNAILRQISYLHVDRAHGSEGDELDHS